ncbi:helix-turn-helix domain-containing protein [Paenibacillus sp. FSL L8-0708]|uniref:helix-turn-helix domain-containing protein n=1 Tax=Paenibacillus sp. FSL L8-0708 TaxID=2975311 RepID=UPI0030F8822E
MSQSFGEYLQQLRKAKGFTAASLGLELNVHPTYISRLEQDRGGVPTPEKLREIAAALDCSFIGMMIKAGHITEAEALGWIGEQQAKSHPSD